MHVHELSRSTCSSNGHVLQARKPCLCRCSRKSRDLEVVPWGLQSPPVSANTLSWRCGSSTFESMPSKSRTPGIFCLAEGWRHRFQQELQGIQRHPPPFCCRWEVGGHKPNVTPPQVTEVKADHDPIRAARVGADTVGNTFMHNDRSAPPPFTVTLKLFVNVVRGDHQSRLLNTHDIPVVNFQNVRCLFLLNESSSQSRHPN